MAWVSSDAARISGSNIVSAVGKADVTAELCEVVESGWIDVGGAHLLKAWYQSYFGERDRFPEVIDYEVAVNGRGIPSLDLTENGELRVSRLLRRGVAFAWHALHRQSDDLPSIRMAAYISAAPTLIDPDHFTGNVTFCTVPLGFPGYIEPTESSKDIIVILFSEDCRNPLPASV